MKSLDLKLNKLQKKGFVLLEVNIISKSKKMKSQELNSNSDSNSENAEDVIKPTSLNPVSSTW